MKTLVLLLLIFSMLFMPLYVQAQGASFSGHDWIRFLPVMKISYISGIYDSSAMLQARLRNDLSEKEVKTVIILPENIPFREVSEKLDEFYSDMENIDIPIIYALGVVKMESEGATQEEISQYKRSLLEAISAITP
jgi:hypothetical protein